MSFDLSISGGNVIIDDDISEANALITAISKKGMPCFIFDGEDSSFPSSKLTGIRFIFIDIELKGTSGQPDKTKASKVVHCIQSIISEDNGIYIIIFWTKHTNVIDIVKKSLEDAGINPVKYLNLEKSECKDAEAKEYDINVIQDKINGFSPSAFHLYMNWENSLHMAKDSFLKDFSSLIQVSDSWDVHTGHLFYKLYKSYSEKNEAGTDTDKFKIACRLLNRSFHDYIMHYTDRNLTLPNGLRIETGTIDLKIISKVNSLLFLSNNLMNTHITGNVYIYQNDDLKNNIKTFLLQDDKHIEYDELVQIIITPECDIAQNKILFDNSTGDPKKIHRRISGILFDYPDSLGGTIKKKDARFDIGPFWYNEKVKILILLLSTVDYITERDLPETPLFSLSRDLFFDLLSKTANHVNRLGNYQLSKD
ncbi:MAG: hypothetical protein HPY53_14890 [Brevinematales bacterium]|nr:hypothetical protein [Brevinematales bacterium]